MATPKTTAPPRPPSSRLRTSTPNGTTTDVLHTAQAPPAGGATGAGGAGGVSQERIERTTHSSIMATGHGGGGGAKLGFSAAPPAPTSHSPSSTSAAPASAGGATISHSIMAAHGASSTAFLQHLQQTWDLHSSMQADTARLKQRQGKLLETVGALEAERDALAAQSCTQSAELARLRESNAGVRREVASMREQLSRVAQSAKAVQDKAKGRGTPQYSAPLPRCFSLSFFFLFFSPSSSFPTSFELFEWPCRGVPSAHSERYATLGGVYAQRSALP